MQENRARLASVLVLANGLAVVERTRPGDVDQIWMAAGRAFERALLTSLWVDWKMIKQSSFLFLGAPWMLDHVSCLIDSLACTMSFTWNSNLSAGTQTPVHTIGRTAQSVWFGIQSGTAWRLPLMNRRRQTLRQLPTLNDRQASCIQQTFLIRPIKQCTSASWGLGPRVTLIPNGTQALSPQVRAGIPG